MNPRVLAYYHLFGIGYGAVRKSIQMSDATVYDWVLVEDPKTKKKRMMKMELPLLIVDKATQVALGGLVCSVSWPLFAYLDARRLEMWVNRDQDPRWNSRPKPRDYRDWFLK